MFHLKQKSKQIDFVTKNTPALESKIQLGAKKQLINTGLKAWGVCSSAARKLKQQ
jgi:hypothetical protein